MGWKGAASVRCHRAGGFTLIELTIVITVIGALMAILLPNMVRARYQAQLTSCEHNLRAIASAMENYSAQYGRYPERLSRIFGEAGGVQFVQHVTCPSNFAEYALDVDDGGKAYTTVCQGIHYLVLPETVQQNFPQYSAAQGLKRRE